MKKRTITMIAGSTLGLIGSLASGSISPAITSLSECFQDYVEDLESCNYSFDNENGDYGTHNNSFAYRACRDAASLNHQSCLDGHPDHLFSSAFNEFQDNLRTCLSNFPSENEREAREACIDVALVEFRNAVEEIIEDLDSQSGCVSDFSEIAMINPISAIESAALSLGVPNELYQAKVNTTLSFTAGINPNPGQPYNSAQIPCLKSAISIAIYQTKHGYAVVPYDADADTTDGTEFNLHLIAGDLVHANEVDILNIFFTEDDLPVLGELSTIELEDSPLSADWNRDEIVNSQDMIDFLDSYGADTERADINKDDQVNPDDIVEYVNQ